MRRVALIVVGIFVIMIIHSVALAQDDTGRLDNVRHACVVAFSGNIRSEPSTDSNKLHAGPVVTYSVGKIASADGYMWYLVITPPEVRQYFGWVREDLLVPAAINTDPGCDQVQEVEVDERPLGLYVVDSTTSEPSWIFEGITIVTHTIYSIYCESYGCYQSNWSGNRLTDDRLLYQVRMLDVFCTEDSCADKAGIAVARPACPPIGSFQFEATTVTAYNMQYCEAVQHGGGILTSPGMPLLDDFSGWSVTEITYRGGPSMSLVVNQSQGVMIITRETSIGEYADRRQIDLPEIVVAILAKLVGFRTY